jgi:hypothetical protein
MDNTIDGIDKLINPDGTLTSFLLNCEERCTYFIKTIYNEESKNYDLTIENGRIRLVWVIILALLNGRMGFRPIRVKRIQIIMDVYPAFHNMVDDNNETLFMLIYRKHMRISKYIYGHLDALTSKQRDTELKYVLFLAQYAPIKIYNFTSDGVYEANINIAPKDDNQIGIKLLEDNLKAEFYAKWGDAYHEEDGVVFIRIVHYASE